MTTISKRHKVLGHGHELVLFLVLVRHRVLHGALAEVHKAVRIESLCSECQNSVIDIIDDDELLTSGLEYS